MPRFFSRFGGLWPDREDAGALLQRRLARGRVTPEEAGLLEAWMRDGYVVLPGAVPGALIDGLNAEFDEAFAAQDDRFLVTVPGSEYPPPIPLESRFLASPGVKLLDFYYHSLNARRALLSEAVVRFLGLLFDEAPLLFQSLSFFKGSQQSLHQDTAYVVVDRPMELVAAWVALEDIRPGSGELRYYPGSHRLPERLFGGKYKRWRKIRDGDEEHESWLRELPIRAEKAGFELRKFSGRKGDVFLWHADLVHGGSPILDQALSRRSIVGHYCPQSRRPEYLVGRGGKGRVVPFGGGFFSCWHYDVQRRAPTASFLQRLKLKLALPFLR